MVIEMFHIFSYLLYIMIQDMEQNYLTYIYIGYIILNVYNYI
jgi:hypothetical protein